jgi:hypothetical protein
MILYSNIMFIKIFNLYYESMIIVIVLNDFYFILFYFYFFNKFYSCKFINQSMSFGSVMSSISYVAFNRN